MAKAAHILIVEDDADLRNMLKLMLTFKGYAVTLSENAEHAAEFIRHNEIDLVLMDMLLSGTNGIDFCSRLKQNIATTHLPVMMISAHPSAKEVCLSAGADDFIQKPFDMPDLLFRINDLVNKK